MLFNIRQSDTLDIDITVDKEHGRLEERICEVYDDLYQIDKTWPNIQTLLKITATIKHYSTGKISTEERYYVSSLAASTPAKVFQKIIRSHWQIENCCHYIKDVTFAEDQSTFRTKNAPLNMSLIRSLAMNVLRLNNFKNFKQARKQLAWNPYGVFGLTSSKF